MISTKMTDITRNKSKDRQMELYQKLLLIKGHNRVEGKPMEMEKIFANHISGKISRIYVTPTTQHIFLISRIYEE